MRRGMFNQSEGKIVLDELGTPSSSGKLWEEVALNISGHVSMVYDDWFGETLYLKTSAHMVEFCKRNDLKNIFRFEIKKWKEKER
jgi:hypothetical protein